MDAIVSVTSDWGIGYKGRLLVPNRQDMRRFRELTENGTVICGRTTFESFPHGALPNRLNIVISGKSNSLPDAIVANDVPDAVSLAEREKYGNGRIWVIGGASIYRQMLPLCESIYVTKNDVIVDADTFFPDLDRSTDWHVVEEQVGGVTENGVLFRFLKYSHI